MAIRSVRFPQYSQSRVVLTLSGRLETLGKQFKGRVPIW